MKNIARIDTEETKELKIEGVDNAKKINLRKVWRYIKNFALVVSIVGGFAGIYKNCTDIKHINAQLPKIKLLLANYETGSDESDYHVGIYQGKPQEVADNGQSKDTNLNLAVIYNLKDGADLPAENIRVWLRCDECKIDTTSLAIDGLAKKEEITENDNQTWATFTIAKHSPPTSLRLRGLKINAPKNKAEIILFYRIEADSMQTVDSKLILKMP